MLRQAVQQSLAQPLHSPPLSTGAAPNSEPRVPAPLPSNSVVLTGPSLPNPPQPLPMAAPSASIQAAPMGRLLPQVDQYHPLHTLEYDHCPRDRPQQSRSRTRISGLSLMIDWVVPVVHKRMDPAQNLTRTLCEEIAIFVVRRRFL
jgi:hypothetical protein